VWKGSGILCTKRQQAAPPAQEDAGKDPAAKDDANAAARASDANAAARASDANAAASAEKAATANLVLAKQLAAGGGSKSLATKWLDEPEHRVSGATKEIGTAGAEDLHSSQSVPCACGRHIVGDAFGGGKATGIAIRTGVDHGGDETAVDFLDHLGGRKQLAPEQEGALAAFVLVCWVAGVEKQQQRPTRFL
jgi:hypothetical protein